VPALVVAVLALLALPRRVLETRLSRTLDAEVSIGVLRLRGFPQIVLEDVRVSQPAVLPWVLGADFPRLDVEVRLGSLMRGRLDRLEVEGGVLRLQARCEEPLRLPEAMTGLEVGALSAAGLDVELRFEDRRTVARAWLDLRFTGGDEETWAGSWELLADEADLELVAVLLTGGGVPACGGSTVERSVVARQLVARGDLKAPSPPATRRSLLASLHAQELEIELEGRHLVVPDPWVEVDWASLESLRAEQIAGRFELGPLGGGNVTAQLDPESGAFTAFDGEARGLDLGVLLPLALPPVAGAEGTATARLRLGDEGEGVVEGIAKLPSLRVRTPSAGVSVAGIELALRGTVDGRARSATLGVDGGAQTASLDLPGGTTVESSQVRIEAAADVALAEEAPRLRVDGLSAELAARLAPWGQVEAALEAASLDPAARLEGTWSWRGPELGVLASRLAPEAAAGWTFAGSVAGSGRIAGSIAEPELAGRLTLDGLEVASGDLAVGFSAERAELSLRRRAGGAVELGLATSGEVLAAGLEATALTLAAGGRLDGDMLELEHSRIELGTDGALGVLTAVGRGTLGSALAGTLRLEGADVSTWYRRRPADATGEPRRLAPSGRIGADLSWELGAEGWSLSGDLAFVEGALTSADGSRVIAPLAWTWQLTGSGTTARATAEVDGELGGFQLLWSAVFADYGDHRLPFELALEATRQEGSASAWGVVADLELALTRGSTARLRLERAPSEAASPETLGYRLEWRADELSPVIEELLRQPLAAGGRFEHLAGSGTLDLELSGAIAESSFTARGTLRAVDVGLRLRERGAEREVSIAGLDLELPIDLTASVDAEGEELAVEGPGMMGTIGFAALVAGGVSIPATTARLAVEGATMQLVDPVSIPVLGGVAILEDSRFHPGLGDPEAGPRLELALELDDLELGRITDTFDLFPLEGRVGGSFPHVVVTRGELRTRGSGELSFFGGQARVEEVAVTDLWSRFPRLTFSAQFEGLDLAQITRSVEFGEITGRGRGELRAVEIVGGSPVRFVGRVESERVEGVPQQVSLKAANNIVLLGTGTGGALKSTLFTTFFDRFPYVGLGVELALAHDRFQLRGLERRGDKELFLKGRWPVRLDVVNVNPGATVSFKTMMSRLENLEIGRPQGREGEPSGGSGTQ
jgi:hypothetical protein